MTRYSWQVPMATRFSASKNISMKISRKIFTNLRDIVKETRRLLLDPELFPSRYVADYFWEVIHFYLYKFAQYGRAVQNSRWENNKADMEEVSTETDIIKDITKNKRIFHWDKLRLITCLTGTPFKYCPLCTTMFRVHFHAQSSQKDGGKAYVIDRITSLKVSEDGLVDQSVQFERQKEDNKISFVGPDGKVYRLQHHENTLKSFMQTRYFRMRMRDRCIRCKETYITYKGEDAEVFVPHKLQPHRSTSRKTWQKWFRNSDKSPGSGEEGNLRRNCLIKQRIPPAANMLLRRARFMYSSIRRRYENVSQR